MKRIMNDPEQFEAADLRRGFFGRDLQTDKRSRLPMVIGVLIIAAIAVGSRAAEENDSAGWQQAGSGIVTGCQYGRRGGESCSYTFPVNEKQYLGSDQVHGFGYRIGQTLVICYDSRDPRKNGLEDFSEKCRGDRDAAFALLAIAVVLMIVWYFSVA